MKATIDAFSNTATSKVNQLNNSKSKYMTLAMLAGFFVGLGIILIFTIGGLLAPDNYAGTKIIMGVSFGIALSLVIMAGYDLFTGNKITMMIGTLTKKTTWIETLSIYLYCKVGNIAGLFIDAVLFFITFITLSTSYD